MRVGGWLMRVKVWLAVLVAFGGEAWMLIIGSSEVSRWKIVMV